MSERWKIEEVRGEWRSVGGPDYECESEIRVVDARTGKVVLTFTSSGDWAYMTQPEHSGAKRVELAPDGRHVVVHDHDGTSKTVALPED